MSSGGDEKRKLLESSSSPCKQQQLKFEVGPTSKSESVQEKVLLLREIKFSDLFPTKETTHKPEPHKEGSSAPFLKKLWRRHLNIPLSAQRKKKFLRWEIHIFLNGKDLGEFIGKVNTIREVREKLSTKVLICFEEKDWHFNTSNNIDGDQDAYKLLCLGSRGKVDDPIADYYNQVGSTLCSDLSYGDFRSLVFEKLRWGDTEYEGFNKAIELKNRDYPEMSDLLIPCVLHDWTTYHNGLYRYDRLIDLHYELWNKVKEEGKFSEILSELLKRKEYASIERDVVERDFHNIRNYVSKRQHEIAWGKTIIFQIAKYFEGMKPVDCSDRGYSLYVKKKIKKAIQLGIIKKEDADVSKLNNF